MIAGLFGRLFVAVARFVPGVPGRDLDHVGRELVRLEARWRQARTSR